MQEAKDEFINFVRRVYPVNPEKATAIVDFFDEKAFNRGDIVVKEGRLCNEYYFLHRGFMRAWTTNLEGKEITTAFYPAGNVFCELSSFFKRIPSRRTFRRLQTAVAYTYIMNDYSRHSTQCLSLENLAEAY